MPPATCKTSRRRENARSSTSLIFVAGDQEKVQRAVLFPSFVEATLRNVSMLTFSRRRFGPVREEVLFTHAKPLCLDVEDRNLQRAEDRAAKTWRIRVEDSITVAARAVFGTRCRDVSMLTWSVDPRRPGVQPPEPFLRVKWASTGETIPSLALKRFSSEEASRSSVPELFTRRNELVQDRDAGDMWYAFIPPRERPCQS
jgi:hypothetical protein